jgi:hypothetical protein
MVDVYLHVQLPYFLFNMPSDFGGFGKGGVTAFNLLYFTFSQMFAVDNQCVRLLNDHLWGHVQKVLNQGLFEQPRTEDVVKDGS